MPNNFEKQKWIQQQNITYVQVFDNIAALRGVRYFLFTTAVF